MTKQSAAHVRGGVPRACGLPGCSSGCKAAARQAEFDAVVSAELVACTLGQRDPMHRIELRMTVAEQALAALDRLRESLLGKVQATS